MQFNALCSFYLVPRLLILAGISLFLTAGAGTADDEVMIKRATMSDYGFRVGEFTITFFKDGKQSQ